jgi:hypothetical protein
MKVSSPLFKAISAALKLYNWSKMALLGHRGSLRLCPFLSTTDIAEDRSHSLTICYRSLDQLDEVVCCLEGKL